MVESGMPCEFAPAANCHRRTGQTTIVLADSDCCVTLYDGILRSTRFWGIPSIMNAISSVIQAVEGTPMPLQKTGSALVLSPTGPPTWPRWSTLSRSYSALGI